MRQVSDRQVSTGFNVSLGSRPENGIVPVLWNPCVVWQIVLPASSLPSGLFMPGAAPYATKEELESRAYLNGFLALSSDFRRLLADQADAPADTS